ncbi:hypothetical protein [Deinococcus sp. KNUC1210]|uniref:hypothetical protein n=1 Tax=Deinococcus sp. KNUC1210 TaxID=2917691 RepID=UPI00351D327E
MPDGPSSSIPPALEPRVFPSLEARYGPLTPADAGMQSRVYRAGELMLKVYRSRRGNTARRPTTCSGRAWVIWWWMRWRPTEWKCW